MSYVLYIYKEYNIYPKTSVLFRINPSYLVPRFKSFEPWSECSSLNELIKK